ncbi:MAG: hypothetical protein MZU91_05195 [Desulfosudis oleivorans]|nr:hypothetical protein [Desulfosudis oleivorans]
MQVVQYRQIPKYPFVDRDTAIIVDTPLESAAVMQMLAAYPSDLIEDMTLFDVFQGGSIPAGKKSLAFTVRYRLARADPHRRRSGSPPQQPRHLHPRKDARATQTIRSSSKRIKQSHAEAAKSAKFNTNDEYRFAAEGTEKSPV